MFILIGGANLKKIAVVDDEKDIVEIVSFYLEREGFEIKKFYDGESFLKSLYSESFDAVVLDLMLPGIDGSSLIKIIRENKEFASLPIIVLTAKSSEEDILQILESGADNYITKPFKGRVLAARVKALLRRTSRSEFIVFKGIRMDNERFEVYCNGKKVPLTRKEFEILGLLLSRPGKVFTRAEFLDCIWNSAPEEPFDRSIDVHIRHIREKLGECGKYIVTVRGVGYKISE